MPWNPDYKADPIKALVRRYDAAVVAKGERSIFTIKRDKVLTAASRKGDKHGSDTEK